MGSILRLKALLGRGLMVHPPCPHCSPIRAASNATAISTTLTKRSLKAKKKGSKQLTEIIQVRENSATRESTRLLSKLKLNPSELERCIESLTTATPPELAEEGLVILNHAPSANYTLPTENDLIDHEPQVPPDKPSEALIGPVGASKLMNKKDREATAKVRSEEMERLGRELSLNKSLQSFVEMCVFTGDINRGLASLSYYRARAKTHHSSPNINSVAIYNTLLHGFAANGNIFKVRELFRWLIEDKLDPSPQSYAALLECLGRNTCSRNNLHSIRKSINYLESAGFCLDDLFNKVIFEADQREVVLGSIRRVQPNYVPTIIPPPLGYDCPLLSHLNNPSSSVLVSQAEISSVDLALAAQKQLEMERNGTLTVKSIEKKENLERLPYFRKMAEETEVAWSCAIKEALERNLNTLLYQGIKHKSSRAICLYPFLKVLPSEDYVRIIIQEIRKLAEGSETYSPGVLQLYRELGAQVLGRYQVLAKEKKGILDKVKELYAQYLEAYLHPTCSHNSRQTWQCLLYPPNCSGPHVDVPEKVWPNSVLSSVGRFLYGIIMRDIKIDANVMKHNSKHRQLVPAFYSIFRMQAMHLKEEIKPHPALVKLFQAASRDELTFDTTLVPMLCPPMPWASIHTGGYLLSPAHIVRLPYQAHQQKLRLESCSPTDLYPSLDSLNQLGAVAWKINHKVLDTIISVFNNKGDESLNVPQPPSEVTPPAPIEPGMSRQEKYKAHKERAAYKRKKGEMYSLWCDALYRLSLANHFRNDIFWFPHNMDFRGRVYPCPPHLNHLGADVARAILVFSKGMPLGPDGLNWLKIHLINLTGTKKKESIEQRLAYADEIMDDILDSADDPLNGRKWWTSSEEPWQTLACCIEIANALRSPSPSEHISHFPIHQDGSCNGLQHYAALGRDQTGAESVNLAPSAVPQDVYSAVALRVEQLREKDAASGLEIAKALDGFIKRKVIKQTVMTTVYGVTKYGARLQIAKQLKDIPEFPKDLVWQASLYLVGKTFDSLQSMFSSTKLIQDWFTESARQISQVCGQNVEWITPLGLPVVQPYFKMPKKSSGGSSDVASNYFFDLYERPNVMKQKNAFPPNFIHSLDSSHMMLTSLNCEREGITFVSVHDCYWTHPASVHVMNRVCREQFVALHSQPILQDLSDFLVQKYSYGESDLCNDGGTTDASKLQLNAILKAVPPKGDFDLSQVLNSVFFFS